MTSPTTVLVTGGLGAIGAPLVRRLVAEGHSVRVLDDCSRGHMTRLGESASKIEFVHGDVRDAQTVREAALGVEILIHLAAVNGTRFFYECPDRVLEVGIKGAINTIEAALEAGVRRYVVASSSEVYQQPLTVPTPETERLVVPDVFNPRFSYGASKIITEFLALHLAFRRGLEVVVFRPHNVYGPDMGFEHVIPQFVLRMKTLSKNGTKRRFEFPILDSGKERRCFCFIEDAIEGVLICVLRGASGQIYHIGDDREEIEITELAKRVAAHLDLEITAVPGVSVPGQPSRRVPSIARIKQLGYCPRGSLEEGLRKTVLWYWEQDAAHFEDWPKYLAAVRT